MAEIKTVSEGVWVVDRTTELSGLTIAEGASIKAPEGKYVVMTVNGRGTTIAPGTYTGNVVLSVADEFEWETYRFGKTEMNKFRAGIVVKDGKYLPEHSVPAIVQGGYIRDGEAGGMYINTREWDFNGFYVTGGGEYVINDLTMNLVGDGTDDFCGLGAGIAVSGKAKVTVNNAEIHSFGISRGAAFVGEDSEVTFNDCFFTMDSGTYTQKELDDRLAGGDFRMMEPPWVMGIKGHGRTTNLAGMATANYNRCHIMSNSWGVLSVDGGCVTRMNVKDSVLELTGETGYGVFSIADDVAFDYAAYGDFGCFDTLDHTIVKGVTYPIIMSNGKSGGEFKNRSEIYARWGCLCFRNSGGHLNVNSGTLLKTELSSFMCKGANSYFNVDDAILEPGNGVIMQLMDNDETGMGGGSFYPAHGETDTYVEGRGLSAAVPTEDVFLSISNMETRGDVYNSTTNLFVNCRPDPEADPDEGHGPPPMDFGQVRGMGRDLQGPKNLDVRLSNATLTGIISSAKQEYPAHIRKIEKKNYRDLSVITQQAQAPVNNGVILTLDKDSTWNVTGSSWLTKLTIEEGAVIAADGGKKLSATVNGEPVELKPGEYTGVIAITVA